MQTKQINITFVYNEDIISLSQIKTVDIRNKIIEIWDKEPIITQFPNMIAIVEPTLQISCIIQGKMATISNQDIKDFEQRDLDNFLRFIIDFTKIIGKTLNAYGYNYNFLIDFPKGEEAAIKGKNDMLLNLEVLDIKPKVLIGGGINVSYMDNDERIQIISSPIYDNETLKLMLGLEVQVNVHFIANVLPAFSSLVASFRQNHDKIREKLNKVFYELS